MTIIANLVLILVVLVALCFVVGYFKGRNQTYVVEAPKAVKKAPAKKTAAVKPTVKKVAKKTTKKTK